MITCKSCGELVLASLAYCQRCGMPLSSANRGEAESRRGAQEQSELPAWLESLRVSERPNSPVSGQSFFSTADLIDEGALPSWMRPENTEMAEKGNSGKYPAWRSAAMSAPNTDSGIIPPKGFPASSLIDEQSLPSWVQGNQRGPQATGESTFVTHNVQGQGSFSAASLIQPEDLPDWMGGQSSQPGQHGGFPADGVPQGSQPGLSASSLVDVNSLPTWLREGEPVQRRPDQMQANSPGQSGQIPIGSGGLTGASLIDTNALPSWLRSSETQQQAGMPPSENVRPLSNAAVPRVEGARVPSRPRAEMAPHEQSEVAANVFSSMLGVASSAPYFPSAGTQWNSSTQNTMAYSQEFQGGQTQSPVVAQWNAPQPSGHGGVPPVQMYNPTGYPVGQQGTYPPGGYVGSGAFPMGSQPGMAQQPPAYGQNMPPQPPMTDQKSSTNAPVSKPAKRGFIETIRSWFT